ncbi:MAG TPA: VOC family protein, partial [Anaerolineae bacterium]|nr:VOC family protein [Anaerolineae bacterium]
MAIAQVAKTEERPIDQEGDFLRINAMDHVEFWVGNAKQAAHYWRTAFGFRQIAYSGLETGNRRYASYVMEQGKVRFVLSTPYSPHDEMAAHHLLHGDGVKVVALEVDDVEQAWRETTVRGARGLAAPAETKDDFGHLRAATIAGYGQTVFQFVDRSDYRGAFKPGYQPVEEKKRFEPAGLAAIDHIVGNVELGKMNTWVDWFHTVMGFRQIVHYDDKTIHTEYSALMSKVMGNGNGRIKFPINEPAEGRKKSQIEEYLDYYVG